MATVCVETLKTVYGDSLCRNAEDGTRRLCRNVEKRYMETVCVEMLKAVRYMETVCVEMLKAVHGDSLCRNVEDGIWRQFVSKR